MTERVKRLPDDGSIKKLTFRTPELLERGIKDLSQQHNVSISFLLTSIVADRLNISGYELPEQKLNT